MCVFKIEKTIRRVFKLLLARWPWKADFQFDADQMALSANQIEAEWNLANRSTTWPASIMANDVDIFR